MTRVRPDGTTRCYLCGGLGREDCPACSGRGELHVREMAQTHDGRIRLAEVAGPMLRAGALPEWMWHMGPEARSSVETLASNECKRCGTYLLELEWVGSAYCSRRCCVEDHLHDWEYASMILREVGGRGDG